MDKPKLLILDDEKEVLNSLNRALRKEFELFLFTEPEEALDFYRQQFIPLVVTDMRMPKMDGTTFLGKIIEINSKCKKFLLTGHADIESTVNAVNEGKIDHYFAKPWDNKELIAELKNAYSLFVNERKTLRLLKLNQQKNAELSLINSSLELGINKSKKKLKIISNKEAKGFARLKKTFSTFIDIYAEAISLHTLDTTKHNCRVAGHARLIAEKLGCDKLTCFQIQVSALLYEAGKLSLTQELLKKSIDIMEQNERSQYECFYGNSADMLSKIDELAFVAEIIRHIPEYYNGTGLPDHLSGDEIPLGSRIVAVAIMYDNLIIGRQLRVKYTTSQAKARINELSGVLFDEDIVKVFLNILSNKTSSEDGEVEYLVNVSELIVGAELNNDMINTQGSVLLTKGTIVEQSHIDKLAEIEEEHGYSFNIAIKSGYSNFE